MRIQGKRIWIAGQFMAAQLAIEDGVIKQVTGYGSAPADEDYGDSGCFPASSIFILTELMILIQMTGRRRALRDG